MGSQVYRDQVQEVDLLICSARRTSRKGSLATSRLEIAAKTLMILQSSLINVGGNREKLTHQSFRKIFRFITIHMPQRTSKILLVRLTANKKRVSFQIRVTRFARYTV